MKKFSALKLSAAVLAVLPLVGCGGGGSGSGSSGNSTPTSTTMTVTPSLGQFKSGVLVQVIGSSGTVLGTGKINDNGSANIDIGSYKGAVQVVVDGSLPDNNGAQYYDEASQSWTAFGSQKLRALDPDVTKQSQVGVTPLTEVAAQYNDKVNNGAISTVNATVSNGFIVGSLTQKDSQGNTTPIISNILTPPVPVSDKTKNQSVDATTPAGNYAIVLAALAKDAQSQNKTAADEANLIAANIANKQVALPPAATLASDMQAAAGNLATTSSAQVVATIQPVVQTDLTKVTLPVSTTEQGDVDNAKQVFSNLRAAAVSLKSGQTSNTFLQGEALKLSQDMSANVTGRGTSFVDATVSAATGANMIRNLQAGNTSDFWAYPATYDSSGNVTATTYADHAGYCQVTVPTGQLATSVTSVNCHFGWYAWGNSWSSDGSSYSYSSSFDTMTVKAPQAAGDNYTYTAQAITETNAWSTGSYDPVNQIWVNGTNTTTDTPNGPLVQGTIALVTNGSNQLTSITVNGDLPLLQADSDAGGKASLQTVTATRSISTSGLVTYALTGTYAYAVNGTQAFSFALQDGTQLVQQQVGTSGATNGVSATLKGVMKTASFEYDGVFDVNQFQLDASKTYRIPTHADFTGTVKDLTLASGNQLFQGKLTADLNNFTSFDHTKPESASNFIQMAASVSGNLTLPNEDAKVVTLGASRTALNQFDLSLVYSSGTQKVSASTSIVRGANGVAGTDQTAKITGGNIEVDLTRHASDGSITGTVTSTADGQQVASISGNTITYANGDFASIF